MTDGQQQPDRWQDLAISSAPPPTLEAPIWVARVRSPLRSRVCPRPCTESRISATRAFDPGSAAPPRTVGQLEGADVGRCRLRCSGLAQQATNSSKQHRCGHGAGDRATLAVELSSEKVPAPPSHELHVWIPVVERPLSLPESEGVRRCAPFTRLATLQQQGGEAHLGHSRGSKSKRAGPSPDHVSARRALPPSCAGGMAHERGKSCP